MGSNFVDDNVKGNKMITFYLVQLYSQLPCIMRNVLKKSLSWHFLNCLSIPKVTSRLSKTIKLSPPDFPFRPTVRSPIEVLLSSFPCVLHPFNLNIITYCFTCFVCCCSVPLCVYRFYRGKRLKNAFVSLCFFVL